MSPRPWRNGSLPYVPPGDGHVCGDLSWFSEGCPSDAPPLARSPSGLATCCVTGGMILGGGYKIRYGGGMYLGGDYVVSVLCQPYYTTNLSTSTLEYLYLGLFWGPGPRTSVSSQFTSPINFVDAVTFVNATGTPCSGVGSTTATIIIVAGGPIETTPLTLISYDPSTHVGVWQVPAGYRTYGGHTFAYKLTP